MLGSRGGGVKPRSRGGSHLNQRDRSTRQVRGARPRSHEQPDTGDACASVRRHFSEAIQRHTADREHRNARGPHDAGQTIETEDRMPGGLAGGRPDSARDQIVDGGSGGGRIQHSMNGSPDHELRGRDRSDGGRWN